uniref:Interleukin-4 n=1 Tax=Pavo cristatus TaxID=9049 RepID=A0A8C9LCV3_PAVCR
MHRALKAALALLCLAALAASTPWMTSSSSYAQNLSDIIHRIQQLNRRAQVPCNDTRVAQVAFMDRKLPEQELLCQAATVLAKVTRCKKDYEPLITSLQSLHNKMSCSLSTDNEIYLRNFLPALGNFTQALYQRIPPKAAK